MSDIEVLVIGPNDNAKYEKTVTVSISYAPELPNVLLKFIHKDQSPPPKLIMHGEVGKEDLKEALQPLDKVEKVLKGQPAGAQAVKRLLKWGQAETVRLGTATESSYVRWREVPTRDVVSVVDQALKELSPETQDDV